MKTTLLATTAIAAATGLAMLSSPAEAQSLKLGISGYFQAYVGYFDADNLGNTRHFDFFKESEIHFNGEVALDNGMKVGIDVQLEGETSGDQIDESYLYFQGDFGKVILGSENSAAYLMSYGAPTADSNFDGADPNYPDILGGINFAYVTNMSGDSEKITYMTPRFAGFAAGVSWTPDNTEDQAGRPMPAIDEDLAQQNDIWEFAINYENKFGDFGVLGSVTYGFGNTERKGALAVEDQDQWSVGLNLTYAGFTVGGTYVRDDQGLSGDNERETWAFGLSWANGPLRVGASAAFNDNNATFDTDRYALGAAYTYAPGMQLRGSLLYFDTHDHPNDIDEGFAAVMGTVITF